MQSGVGYSPSDVRNPPPPAMRASSRCLHRMTAKDPSTPRDSPSKALDVRSGIDSATLATTLLSRLQEPTMTPARIRPVVNRLPVHGHGRSTGVREFLRRPMDRLRQMRCGLHGHEMLLHFEHTRVSLRCFVCGAETPGWTIDERRDFCKSSPYSPDDRVRTGLASA